MTDVITSPGRITLSYTDRMPPNRNRVGAPGGRRFRDSSMRACSASTGMGAGPTWARPTIHANGLNSEGAMIPPQEVPWAWRASQKIRGGTAGQYIAIAALRISLSEMGGDVSGKLWAPTHARMASVMIGGASPDELTPFPSRQGSNRPSITKTTESAYPNGYAIRPSRRSTHPP